MAQFIKVAGQKSMLKLKIEGKETWAFCPEAVKKYASETFKENDSVDIVSETKSDGLHVSRISHAGQGGSAAPSTQAAPPAASTTASPGTAAKSTYTGNYRQPMTPEESRIVRRQSVMAAACQAVCSVTSQIDPNALPDYVINMFNRLLAEVEK